MHISNLFDKTGVESVTDRNPETPPGDSEVGVKVTLIGLRREDLKESRLVRSDTDPTHIHSAPHPVDLSPLYFYKTVFVPP